MSNKISRRKFIGQAGCAAMGTTTLFSTLMNLNSLNALAAQPSVLDNDYKAVVCLLLSGGCDSFNLLVPRGLKYPEYSTTRGAMALPENELLPINTLQSNGLQFGLHPKMKKISALFEQEKAAFISSIGTLVQPFTDINDYNNNKNLRPKGLFSHSDQIQQWQTSIPQNRTIAKGWAGRMADIMHTVNHNQHISMNISLSGRNVFQAGDSVVEYAIKNSGVEGIRQIEGGKRGMLNRIRDNAVDNILSQEYSNVLESTYASLNQNTIQAYSDFSHSVKKIEPFVTKFSDSTLSKDMEMIAKVMATRNDLQMKKQTFFVNYGGWDHHSNLIAKQNNQVEVVDNAIGEFYSALTEMGLQDKVTLFTISDFARTLTSNDTGTDHAWGGNALVVGGAVNGRKIYGTYPDLYLKDNPRISSGRGNVLPIVSTDEYFAELALWFGLPPGNLKDVLPNIGNFYSYNPSQMPLGFMRS